MRPKAAEQPDPAELAGRYEQLRAIATAGHGAGWRHGLGVLAAKGVAAWMAAWATVPTTADLGGTAATTPPQADSSPSTTTQSPPTPDPKGGPQPACTSLPPAATTLIVAVLAQMTLAHARRVPPPVQEANPP